MKVATPGNPEDDTKSNLRDAGTAGSLAKMGDVFVMGVIARGSVAV